MRLGSEAVGSLPLGGTADARARLRERWRAFVHTSWGQVGSSTVAGVIGTMAASAQSFVLAVLLGPEAFGSLVLLTSTVELIESLANPNAYEAMLRFTGQHDARRQPADAWAVLLLAAAVDAVFVGVFIVGLWATGGWIGGHLLRGQLGAGAILIYALTALERPLGNVSRVIFAIGGRADVPPWFDCGTLVVRSVLAIAALLLGYGILGVLWTGTAAVLGMALLKLSRAVRHGTRRWGRPSTAGLSRVVRAEGRQLLRFGALNNVNYLLAVPAKQLDSLVVGWIGGLEAAAFLRIAKGIASLVGLLVAPMQAVTYPRLVAARCAGVDPLQDLVRRVAVRVALPVGILALLVVPVIPPLVPAVMGPAYAPGAAPAALLFAGSVAWLISFWVRPVLLACDRVGVITAMTTASSVIAAGSYFFVVPRWGLVGYAAVACVSQIVTQGGGAIVVRRVVRA